MRATVVPNVRSGDTLALECNGHMDYFVLVLDENRVPRQENWYRLERITREDYERLTR